MNRAEVRSTSASAGLAIVGGGLAGTLLAQAWIRAGRTDLLWFDHRVPGRGSDSRCALIHPFAGWSFAPKPDLFAAWQAVQDWCDSLPSTVPCHRARVRRVVRADPAGLRLRASLDRHRATFPDALSLRIEPDRPAEIGFIEYGPVIAVDLDRAIIGMTEAWGRSLQPHADRVVEIEPHGPGWKIRREHGDDEHADQVIVAAGAGTRELLARWHDTSSLEHFEGMLVHAHGSPLPRFWIDHGHLASTSETIAWGSSYRSLDREEPTDPMARLQAIESQLRPWVPELPPLSAASTWQGVRVVDRRTRAPWVATIRPGLHVFSALGSTGALWAPLLARRLIDALLLRR